MNELEQLRGECVALRGALNRIKRDYGQVCEEFMTCSHPACTSSYSAWATADEALASSPLSEKYAAVVRAAEEMTQWYHDVGAVGLLINAMQPVMDAVDALTEKEKPTDGEL